MKILLQLLCLFLFSGSSFSQSLSEKITGILNQLWKNIPADQLFLHLDRNLYHSGDTIRFQAYIRDKRTGEFITESSALYCLLLNSHHATIDSARFRIFYPTISGWLKIPEDTPPGNYSILAFTSSHMNYSPEFAFTVPIKIDDTLPNQNEAKHKSKNADIPVYQIPLKQPAIDLRFIPEGGKYIYGIQQRLAFSVIALTDRGLEISGVIINQKGVKITEFKSNSYGQGVIEFTPLLNDSYYAILIGEEFSGLEWVLPSPENSGVAMRVNNDGNGLIDIILKGKGIAGRSYLLTITMNNILVFAEDVKLDTLFRKRIKTDRLPSGTAFVTLYDPELNPIAERLIFLNDYKKMHVKIDFSAPSANCGDETELTIYTTDDKGNSISSIVSVAVIDSISGYYDGISLPEIESTYLYDKEFYNNLPFTLISQGLGNIDSKSVDILLMTYGWRKFAPKEVAQTDLNKELVNYDYLKIYNPGPEKKGRSDIRILSIENLDVISLVTNSNREAVLFYDSLDIDVRQILILPDHNPIKNINPVRIEFPENKDFTEKAKRLTTYSNYLISDLPVTSKGQSVSTLDSTIFIAPVTIKAKKQPPKVYVDKYEKMYHSASTLTLYSRDFVSAFSFEDIILRCYPFRLDMQNKKIYLRGFYSSLGDFYSSPALIVLDDFPIDTSYDAIASLPASQIASVTLLRGQQGFYRFGSKAIGGIVFVTTKTGNGFTDGSYPDYEFRRNDDLTKPIRLFRTETDYYVPTKEEVAVIPELQSRPTILWQDNIFIDESGLIKIRYPNNLVKGTAKVFVNGISFTNLVGSNRCSYKVH